MFQSIKHLLIKIKALLASSKEEVLTSLIIISVGFASYGLGKLSVSQVQDAQIDIVKASPVRLSPSKQSPSTTVPTQTANATSVVVASKSGKKYHFPWCAGAKQIAEKNKITFNSTEEARRAGYTPASNCKGLD